MKFEAWQIDMVARAIADEMLREIREKQESNETTQPMKGKET